MPSSIITDSSLEDLVREIETCAKRGDEQTLAAAALVHQLRLRIEAGEAGEGVKWHTWALLKIKLGRSRLYELDAIGRAENPASALEHFRRLNCERQKSHRQNDLEELSEAHRSLMRWVRDAGAPKVQKMLQYAAVLDEHKLRQATVAAQRRRATECRPAA